MTSRLASLLVQENLVAPKTMADAFQRQVIYGGTLDTILLEMNALPEATLLSALGRASALAPSEALPDRERLVAEGVLATVPAELAEQQHIVPHSFDGNTLRVLTIDPPDRRVIDQLAQTLQRPVDALITTEHRFATAMGHVYGNAVPARYQRLHARVAKRGPQTAKAEPTPTPAKLGTPTRIVTPGPSAPPPDEPIPHPHDEQLTPRLTTRELGAPSRVTREIAKPTDAPTETSEPLSIGDAVKAIDDSKDRDAIFVALCRGARSIAEFVALFTVHGEAMTGRAALADRWIDASAMSALSLPLEGHTAFRTTVEGRQAVVGPVGEDEPSRAILERMGRRAPMAAAIAPVVLRERVVSVLYVDNSGKRVAPEVIAELASLTAAATRAFQRLILASKGREYKAPAPEAQAGKLTASVDARPTVAPGEWRGTDGRPNLLHEAPTSRHVAVTSSNLDTLFASVEKDDEQARLSADQIVALGATGADQIVARLPGPVRVDRVGLRGPTPRLEDHGPLLALLARIGTAALPALEARLGDPDATVRYYATLGVGELGRAQQIPRIGKALFDRDASVRKAAIDTLHRQPDSPERTTILESLRGELPGPDKDHQRWAADALGTFGDVQSVPRLIELVKHDDEGIRTTSCRALVNITKQDFGTSRWRWRGWWDRSKTKTRVDWLFEGLSSSSDELRATSASELRAQFPESFGYDADAPKRDREEAKRKWYEWYVSRL